MPDHVHALVWFPQSDRLSHLMKQWKRLSSVKLKEHLRIYMPAYASRIDLSDPIWQAKYYDFNVYSKRMIEEKLAYMHDNPVRAGLVKLPGRWESSSARWYELGRSVGVPIGLP